MEPPCRPFRVPSLGATIVRRGGVGSLAGEWLPAAAAEIFVAFPAGSSYLELCFAAPMVVAVGTSDSAC